MLCWVGEIGERGQLRAPRNNEIIKPCVLYVCIYIHMKVHIYIHIYIYLQKQLKSTSRSSLDIHAPVTAMVATSQLYG